MAAAAAAAVCVPPSRPQPGPPSLVLQLFFRFHIACFLGFFLFGMAHYAGCWMYFTPGGRGAAACSGGAGRAAGTPPRRGAHTAPPPRTTPRVRPAFRAPPAGLLLYAIDLALRAGQLAHATPVAAAVVDDKAGLATIQLKADKVRVAPLAAWRALRVRQPCTRSSQQCAAHGHPWCPAAAPPLTLTAPPHRPPRAGPHPPAAQRGVGAGAGREPLAVAPFFGCQRGRAHADPARQALRRFHQGKQLQQRVAGSQCSPAILHPECR